MYKLSVPLALATVYCLIRNSLEACPATLPTNRWTSTTYLMYTLAAPTPLDISTNTSFSLTGHFKLTAITGTNILFSVYDGSKNAIMLAANYPGTGTDINIYWCHTANSNIPLGTDTPVTVSRYIPAFFTFQISTADPVTQTEQFTFTFKNAAGVYFSKTYTNTNGLLVTKTGRKLAMIGSYNNTAARANQFPGLFFIWNFFPNTELNLDESLHSPAFPYWYLPLIDITFQYVYSAALIPEMKYSLSENAVPAETTFLYTTANYALKSQMWDATYSAGEWSVMGNNQAMRMRTTDLSLYLSRVMSQFVFTARLYITNTYFGHSNNLSPAFFPTLTPSNSLYPVYTYHQVDSTATTVKDFGLYYQIVSWSPGNYQSNLVVLFDGIPQTSRPECITALPNNFNRQSIAVLLFADKIFSNSSNLNATVVLYIGDSTVPKICSLNLTMSAADEATFGGAEILAGIGNVKANRCAFSAESI